MVNFIGNVPDPKCVLELEQTHLHLYAKSARKARKVAHATVKANNQQQFSERLNALIELAKKYDDS